MHFADALDLQCMQVIHCISMCFAWDQTSYSYAPKLSKSSCFSRENALIGGILSFEMLKMVTAWLLTALDANSMFVS